MKNDRTNLLEQAVLTERPPKFSTLLKLWKFIFLSTKSISIIYIGMFILLSLCRPLLAFLWGYYIEQLDGASTKFTFALALICTYYILNFFIDTIQRYVMAEEDIERLDFVQANRQQESFHAKLFEKLSSISPEYLEVPKINDTINQVFSFAGNKWDGMNTQVMLKSYIIIAKIVSVLSIAVSLYIFNPWLTLIVLVAPLPTIWVQTFGEKLRFAFLKKNTILQRRIQYFQDLMLSPIAKEIKVLSLHDFFFRKWKESADEYTYREKILIRRQTVIRIINALIANIANLSCNILAIIAMTMGQLSIGALGAVMTLIETLVNDTGELIVSLAEFYARKNEATQFFNMMDLPEDENKGMHCEDFTDLKLNNISYRYPMTERYVLNNINLHVKKGEKIAFIGENGMGKTTLVKILTGMLHPSSGELNINGHTLDEYNLIEYYKSMGVVLQDPARYMSFTIEENVRLGDILSDDSENLLDKSLSFVGLDKMEKSELLGKDIGGVDLSGGEWQKLAIARAVYRNKDFVILDEPTSSLDPLAESDIYQKYISLSENKNVIFVTHRVSIAALADRIIVIKDGNIVQDGPHSELVEQKGEYARLYFEQAKWYSR